MGFLNLSRGRKDLIPVLPHSQSRVDSTNSIPGCFAVQLGKPSLLNQFSQEVGSATSPTGWVVPESINCRTEEYPYTSSASTRRSLESKIDDEEDLPPCIRGGSIDDFENCDLNSPTTLAKCPNWIDPEFDNQQTNNSNNQHSAQHNVSQDHKTHRLYSGSVSCTTSVDTESDKADEVSNTRPKLGLDKTYNQNILGQIEGWVDRIPHPAEFIAERVMAARADIPPLSPPPYIQPSFLSEDNIELGFYASSDQNYHDVESESIHRTPCGTRGDKWKFTMNSDTDLNGYFSCDADSETSDTASDLTSAFLGFDLNEQQVDDDWLSTVKSTSNSGPDYTHPQMSDEEYSAFIRDRLPSPFNPDWSWTWRPSLPRVPEAKEMFRFGSGDSAHFTFTCSGWSPSPSKLGSLAFVDGRCLHCSHHGCPTCRCDGCRTCTHNDMI